MRRSRAFFKNVEVSRNGVLAAGIQRLASLSDGDAHSTNPRR
jgi:hypothetical protein